MIPQSTINACVKAYYGSMESTDYGKIQAVLMAYESMKATPPGEAVSGDALAAFTEYFVKNYPGPDTIISDPSWHAPKIFRAAQHAIEALAKREATPAVEVTDAMVEAALIAKTNEPAKPLYRERNWPSERELMHVAIRAALTASRKGG